MSANEIVIPFVYAGEVFAAAVVVPLVAIVTVGLRFWLRASSKLRIGLDDWIGLAALVSRLYAVSLHRVPDSSQPVVPCNRHGNLFNLWYVSQN